MTQRRLYLVWLYAATGATPETFKRGGDRTSQTILG